MDFCERLEVELEKEGKKLHDCFRPAMGNLVHYDVWTIWTFQHFKSATERQRPVHLYIFKTARQVYLFEPPGISKEGETSVLVEVLKRVAKPPYED